MFSYQNLMWNSKKEVSGPNWVITALKIDILIPILKTKTAKRYRWTSEKVNWNISGWKFIQHSYDWIHPHNYDINAKIIEHHNLRMSVTFTEWQTTYLRNEPRWDCFKNPYDPIFTLRISFHLTIKRVSKTHTYNILIDKEIMLEKSMI